MNVSKISVDKALKEKEKYVWIDVRSEKEFEKSRVFGAFSFPLFNNEERALVGTLYKQKGRDVAFIEGAGIYGKKLSFFLENFQELSKKNEEKSFLFYCWRGGMRSHAMAWICSSFGIKTFQLEGGYKAFRKRMIQEIELEKNLFVLGGFTGSGKTKILQEIEKEQKIPVIDLEKIANHRGSVFGLKKGEQQPSQEDFENQLGFAIYQIRQKEKQLPILVEDESEKIGDMIIPSSFWKIIRTSSLVFIDMDFEIRLQNILEEYGDMEEEFIKQKVMIIKKRIGGQEVKSIIDFLEKKEKKEAFRILLKYYDKKYIKGLQKRENLAEKMQKISCQTWNEGSKKIQDMYARQ